MKIIGKIYCTEKEASILKGIVNYTFKKGVVKIDSKIKEEHLAMLDEFEERSLLVVDKLKVVTFHNLSEWEAELAGHEHTKTAFKKLIKELEKIRIEENRESASNLFNSNIFQFFN